MTPERLIGLLQRRLETLRANAATADNLGDIEGLLALENSIAETETTLSRLQADSGGGG